MKCLVLMLGLVAVAYGQQCGGEFEGFRKCMKEQTDIPEIPEQEVPIGSVSEEITACFTSSGCHAPQLIGAESASGESIVGVMFKCSKEVKQKMGPLFQQCMTSTPNVGPGFIFHQDLIAPLPLNMPNPPPAPPLIVVLQSISHIYNDNICPTDQTKDAVKLCITSVADKYIPFTPTKSPVETTLALTKHCYSQEVCKTQMTPTCKADIENLRNYLCDCAKTTFADAISLNPLVQTFETCVSREVGAAALQTQTVLTFKTYAQRILTNLMCIKAPDPCKPPAQPQQQGQLPPNAQAQQQPFSQ